MWYPTLSLSPFSPNFSLVTVETVQSVKNSSSLLQTASMLSQLHVFFGSVNESEIIS